MISMSSAMRYAIFCLLLATSCSQFSNQVTVEHRNFEDVVECSQNLIFNFSKELATDSMVGNWDTTQYMQITPHVSGRFKWNTSRELIFTPDQGFAPCASYELKLLPALGNHLADRSQSIQEEVYKFHTKWIELTSMDGGWEMSSTMADKVRLRLNLDFNYKMPVKETLKRMTVLVNGDKRNIEAASSLSSNSMILYIEGFELENIQKSKVKMIIDSGIICENGVMPSPIQIEKEIEVTPPSKLEISQVETNFDGVYGYMDVATNQPVVENDLGSYIKVQDGLQVRVEATAMGFTIRGAFLQSSSYDIIISKALRGKLGGQMEKDFTYTANFAQMEPSIAFTNSKGIYLSSKGAKNIGVNVINLDQVRVKVYKIYNNNLNLFLSSNRYNNYYDESESRSYRYNEYNIDQYGDLIYTHDYRSTDLAANGNARLLHLDLKEINRFKGVYLVKVSGLEANNNGVLYESYSYTDMKLVSVSDVGLIAKKSGDEMWVFANSLKTATPLVGAEVMLVSTNNQELMKMTTSGDGVAVFRNISKYAPGFKVGMVRAGFQDDYNFMLLADAKVEDSRFEVGGYRPVSGGYQAFIYGDRNIYRPGETIHIQSIVRNDQWMPIANMPVKIKLLMPNGEVYKMAQQKLSVNGSTSLDVSLPEAVVTGTYTAELYTSNDVLLQSENISVEEFMPDRIEVKLNTDKEAYQVGDEITARVIAHNLFGPPAVGRKFEAQLNLDYKLFSAEKYQSYNFMLVNGRTNYTAGDGVTGTTDEKGSGEAKFTIPAEYNQTGIVEGKLFATVFDETGRPVHRLKKLNIYTQTVFLGTHLDDFWINPRENSRVPIIAVNKEGNPVSTAARVQLVQVEYFSWYRRDEGNGYSLQSNGKEHIVSERLINIPASGYQYPINVAGSGEYEMRVFLPGAQSYVATPFFAWGYGYTTSSSFEVNNEGTIDIETDRKSYQTGDEAKILFKTPFAGKILVTLERDKVYEYHYINTDKRSGALTIKLGDQHLPNIYITATLFRPLDDGSMPLTVAHGFASIKVEKKDRKLPVEIIATEQSRSKKKQTITVRTAPGTMVEMTIAVVDEGILQVKNYKTPDPYNFFYQKRALEVAAHDVYPFLLPDLKTKNSSTGGDGYDLAMRVNPLNNKRVKLVAIWSGAIKVGANGEVKYSFDIPQFSGDLRIMAVVHKGYSFGSSEKHIKVADPVVISPAIPRFLSPKDTAYIPVTLTNTTGNGAKMKVGIKTTGNLNVSGASTSEIYIPANGESRVQFKIYTPSSIGVGAIDVSVQAFNETFNEHTDITIRPPSSLLKSDNSGVLAANTSTNIDMWHSYIPSTVKAKLVVSRSPMVQFAKNLDYLVNYPHGCVEQTVSAAFPQLYYGDLVKSMGIKGTNAYNASWHVQEALKKLSSMQLYNGGLAYWQGGNYESWWGSVYAAHFMMEASKAGYEVNESVLNRLYEYMGEKLRQKTLENYEYYDGSSWRHKNIAPREAIYSMYILALAGKKDISSMNYYKGYIDLLSLDGRYMLAATYAAVGDIQSYSVLLPKAFEGESSRAAMGGSFYSYTRDLAISLNVLLEIDYNNTQVSHLVKRLSEQLKKQDYINTQEAAFSFLALGKYIKKSQAMGVANATILADGKVLGNFTGKDLILTQGVAGKTIQCKTSGQGSLYYYWAQEGLSADGKVIQEDKNIQVRRSFLDRNGRPINGLSFEQSQLVVVKISLKTTDLTMIDNVVITDMIPAGFEIENPRISSVPELNWITDNANPDHYDVRDDRMNFFCSAERKEKNFYYLVRCVNPGRYVIGPVSADAMYHGEYHSYSGGGAVAIK